MRRKFPTEAKSHAPTNQCCSLVLPFDAGIPIGALRTGDPDRVESAAFVEAFTNHLDQTAAAEAHIDALAAGERMTIFTAIRQARGSRVGSAEDNEGNLAAHGSIAFDLRGPLLAVALERKGRILSQL